MLEFKEWIVVETKKQSRALLVTQLCNNTDVYLKTFLHTHT